MTFISSFPMLILVISFLCLTVLARISGTMLKAVRVGIHFVPDCFVSFKGMLLILQHYMGFG